MASPLDYRWNLIANDDGKMHLVDVNPIEGEPEPFFNAETDTRFLLFTGFNPTVGQRVTWTVDSIHASRFNPVNPVRMIVHGFQSGPGNSVSFSFQLLLWVQLDCFTIRSAPEYEMLTCGTITSTLLCKLCQLPKNRLAIFFLSC